jgi:hypothetical protein
VYLGYTYTNEEGEELEGLERMLCRRCAEERGETHRAENL